MLKYNIVHNLFSKKSDYTVFNFTCSGKLYEEQDLKQLSPAKISFFMIKIT